MLVIERTRQLKDLPKLLRFWKPAGCIAEGVVEAMGGSRSRAERLFRQTTGCSVGEKIEERRMEEVVRLLSDPTLKIATVAAASGYKSGSLLRRRFHAKFGMSMQAWREGLCS